MKFTSRKLYIAIASIAVLLVIVTATLVVWHTKPHTAASAPLTPVNNAIVITKLDPNLGLYLATPAGYPLYTYAEDQPGVSNCTVECLVTWPAYVDSGPATGLPKNFSTITRPDNGQIQFTYKGYPLYTFNKDKPGQINGNGITQFKIAKP